MGSLFEHPSSRALQFLSSLPPLPFFFLLVYPHLPPLFSRSYYALSLFRISPLSRVFPNSNLNVNHEPSLLALPSVCVRYSHHTPNRAPRAVTINCLIIIRKDSRRMQLAPRDVGRREKDGQLAETLCACRR